MGSRKSRSRTKRDPSPNSSHLHPHQERSAPLTMERSSNVKRGTSTASSSSTPQGGTRRVHTRSTPRKRRADPNPRHHQPQPGHRPHSRQHQPPFQQQRESPALLPHKHQKDQSLDARSRAFQNYLLRAIEEGHETLQQWFLGSNEKQGEEEADGAMDWRAENTIKIMYLECCGNGNRGLTAAAEPSYCLNSKSGARDDGQRLDYRRNVPDAWGMRDWEGSVTESGVWKMENGAGAGSALYGRG